MKFYSKILALAYLISVFGLLFLEFSQFQKVDRLRGQISQSYEMISGRDEGIRLELEYRRFRSIAGKYVFGEKLQELGNRPQDTHLVSSEMVQKWFDILWSRAFGINSLGVEVPAEQHDHFETLLANLRDALRKVDPVVQSLSPGNLIAYRDMEDTLAPFEEGITSMAAAIAQTRVSPCLCSAASA